MILELFDALIKSPNVGITNWIRLEVKKDKIKEIREQIEKELGEAAGEVEFHHDQSPTHFCVKYRHLEIDFDGV